LVELQQAKRKAAALEQRLTHTPAPLPPDAQAYYRRQEASMRRSEDELRTLCDALLTDCGYDT
jgi:hypothetical protein